MLFCFLQMAQHFLEPIGFLGYSDFMVWLVDTGVINGWAVVKRPVRIRMSC